MGQVISLNDAFESFDIVQKGFNKDLVGSENYFNSRNSFVDLLKGYFDEVKLIDFGDTQHTKFNVNDIIEVLSDNTEFQNYCDGIIQNQKGQLLILQRTPNDSFGANQWALPGGKAEQGEFLREAVKREVLEETSLMPLHCNYTALYRNPDGSFSHYWWCYVEDYNVLLDADEIQQYEWIDLSDLDKYDFILDLKDRIKQIFNIPFRGRYLTHAEMVALANNKLEKGKKANLGEIREWQGQKVQKTTQGWKIISNKGSGNKTEKIDVESKEETVEEEVEINIDDFSDDELAEYAMNTSETDFREIIKVSDEPRLRTAAHKELKRRGSEEAGEQEEGNKVEEKTEKRGEKIDENKDIKKSEGTIPLSGEQEISKSRFVELYNRFIMEPFLGKVPEIKWSG